MNFFYLRYVAITAVVALSVMAFSLPDEGSDKPNKSTVKAPDTYEYHLQGKVFDERTKVEIGGAKVYVEHKNVVLGETETGEDGSYELIFETTEEYSGADLIFWVKREGYWDKSVTNIPIRPGEPKIVNFKMKRKPVRLKKDPNAKRWETIEYLKELERW